MDKEHGVAINTLSLIFSLTNVTYNIPFHEQQILDRRISRNL